MTDDPLANAFDPGADVCRLDDLGGGFRFLDGDREYLILHPDGTNLQAVDGKVAVVDLCNGCVEYRPGWERLAGTRNHKLQVIRWPLYAAQKDGQDATAGS